MNDEIWKEIPNYSKYQVSNTGKIKSKSRSWVCSRGHSITRKEKILKGSYDKDKYVKVSLVNDNNKIKRLSVHRIVAMVFLEDYNEKLQVNHIDGNKENNSSNNLEMVTSKENIHHAINVLDINYGRYINKMHEVNKKKVIRSDGKIYNQVKDVLKENNIKTKQLLYDVLKGRRKEYNGYSYKYYYE